MGNLTFSIYYTPNENALTDESIKYICSDNKIHIRFTDFNKPRIIMGFEQKITYLFTYLINFCYIPKLIGNYTSEEIVNNFLKTSDIFTINSCIAQNLDNSDVEGFKLRSNYKKKECKTFGDVDKDVFPLVYENGIAQSGDLDTFLKILRINLSEYLFNDKYVIVIRDNKNIDINKKFKNKMRRKHDRVSSEQLAAVELW